MGHDTDGFSPHPENHVRMAPWEGDATDTTLEQSIDFLEMLAFSRQADVRPLLAKHAAGQFPGVFEARQQEAFESLRRAQLETMKKRADNWFFRLFGMTHPAKAGDVSKSYQEKKAERMELRRKEYARIYQLMQKQLEAEMQKEKAYYAEHKMPIWDLFSKGPPPAPPVPENN